MRLSDFEEKEYEGPLYNQLEKSTNLLWAPGQCFEEHIGIDRCILIEDQRIWKAMGINSVPIGAYLPRYDWGFIWKKRRKKKSLPSFKLNLFIQAKRPYYGNVPKKAKGYCFGTNCYKFDIVEHQQQALEQVASMLKNRAILIYAAAKFHNNGALYKHTRNSTIIQNSTFPEIHKLSGHKSWFYNSKVDGVAFSEPFIYKAHEPISYIKNLMENSGNSNEDLQTNDLILLRDLIYKAFEKTIETTPEVALLFEKRDEFNNLLKYEEIEPDHYEQYRAYFEILLFIQIFNLDWYVVGNEINRNIDFA